jgi:hypothetical protein
MHDSAKAGTSDRRDFLQQVAGAAAGAAALAATAAGADAPPLLPTIQLGKHTVTRLIIGGNPLYGHSHFNKLYSQHQMAWATPENVVGLIQRCERAGINTWQNSYAPRTLTDVERVREAGCKVNWLLLGKGDWDEKPELIADAAKRKPIGIAPHGAMADRLHRLKKLTELADVLKRIRDQGVLVGLSCHNPALVATAEEKGWDFDYYMCCLYYLSRPKDEYRKLLGGAEVPLGEVYLPSDPPKMFSMIQQTRKPCLAYKVLAAGRRTNTPAEIRKCFAEVFANIKPTDAIIVGMYNAFGDQVSENAAMVRELASRARG